jgi:hypothetical protein
MGTSARATGDDELVTAAVTLIDEVAPYLRPDAVPELAAMRTALTEPLRIALAGRVSAGKSTLANALLGRRIAPTAAGECTQVVTWYRFGSPDRAEMVMRDGSARPLPLADGLPPELGVPPSAVERIEVTLQSGPLRHYTLIDTPGLGAVHRPGDTAVRGAVLHGGGADGDAHVGADAVLFLFRDLEKRDDMDFVEDYRRSVETAPTGAVTVIGVLSHADVFGSGPWSREDPFDGAAALARRMADEHADQLAAVVPVAGLLAEAARTGRVTESDARGLAALADVDAVRLTLYEALGLPEGADPAVIEGVLDRAGPYVLAHGRAVAARGGAVALRDWMDERSGLGDLEELIGRRFARRSRPLKVAGVVARLERLARGPAGDGGPRDRVHDLIEDFRLDRRTHRVEELTALARLAGTDPRHSAVLRERLSRLVDHDEPWEQLGCSGPAPAEELRTLARRLAAEARAQATLARHPVQAAAAEVLSRAYRHVADSS